MLRELGPHLPCPQKSFLHPSVLPLLLLVYTRRLILNSAALLPAHPSSRSETLLLLSVPSPWPQGQSAFPWLWGSPAAWALMQWGLLQVQHPVEAPGATAHCHVPCSCCSYNCCCSFVPQGPCEPRVPSSLNCAIKHEKMCLQGQKFPDPNPH